MGCSSGKATQASQPMMTALPASTNTLLSHPRDNFEKKSFAPQTSEARRKCQVSLDVEEDQGSTLLIHRAFDMLREMESAKQGGANLEKTMSCKQVKLNNKLLCWSKGARLQWGSYAKSRYSADELEQIKAVVEDVVTSSESGSESGRTRAKMQL